MVSQRCQNPAQIPDDKQRRFGLNGFIKHWMFYEYLSVIVHVVSSWHNVRLRNCIGVRTK